MFHLHSVKYRNKKFILFEYYVKINPITHIIAESYEQFDSWFRPESNSFV